MPFFTRIRNAPPGERLSIGLFLALWSTAFIAFSIFATYKDFVLPLRDHHGWAQAVQVSAELVRVATTQSGRGNVNTCLSVEYRYRYQGRDYTTQRIRVVGETCNDSRFSHLQDRTRLAQKTGTTIVAWVHPDHPDWAVLDRDVAASTLFREALLYGFFLLMGMLVMAISLGMLWPHSEAQRLAIKGAYPRRAPVNPLWVNQNLQALVFNSTVFGFILAVVAISSSGSGGLLIVLVGTGMFEWARRAWRWWPWRGVNLTMCPSTPRLGDTVQFQITLPRRHRWPSLRPAQRVTVALTYPDKSGKNSKSHRTPPIRWQQATAAGFHRPPQTDAPYELEISLALPTEVDGRPSGLTARGKAVTWTLEVTPTARASAPLCIEFFVGARANAGDPLNTPADVQGAVHIQPPAGRH